MTYSINTPSWRIMCYRRYYQSHPHIASAEYVFMNVTALRACVLENRPVTILIY